MIHKLSFDHKLIVTMEENVGLGGFGDTVCQYADDSQLDVKVLNIALPDDYVEHGNVSILKKKKELTQQVWQTECYHFIQIYRGKRYGKRKIGCSSCEQRTGCFKGKAKAVIMSGCVYVDGQKEDKAGSTFPEEAQIEVRGNTLKYVSRGGLKLEKAMENFDVTLEGKVCMDVGSSTGGFTDCMLQNGAVKVYAVDVGHGQLAWKLRNDERVVCMEKTNIRYVTPEDIADKIQFSSIDVSFISLTKVLGPVKALLAKDGQIVCLIKPQFEAGREKVGKHGVVRDPAVHLEVINMVIDFAVSIGFEIKNLTFSPVKGPEGNIEYLLHLQNHAEGTYEEVPVDASAVVEEAHAALDK